MNLCGRPSQLHDAARDAANLEERLLALYGVGPVTMNIFLRELRLFWTKAKTGEAPLDRSRQIQPKKRGVHEGRAGLIRRRRELAATEAAIG
jgi:hypothetical protein